MSVYLSIDGDDEGSFISSNTGWGDFVRWVETLDGYDDLAHLAAHGWTGDVKETLADLVKALAESPPTDDSTQDVADELRELLTAHQGAEAATVTNG